MAAEPRPTATRARRVDYSRPRARMRTLRRHAEARRRFSVKTCRGSTWTVAWRRSRQHARCSSWVLANGLFWFRFARAAHRSLADCGRQPRSHARDDMRASSLQASGRNSDARRRGLGAGRVRDQRQRMQLPHTVSSTCRRQHRRCPACGPVLCALHFAWPTTTSSSASRSPRGRRDTTLGPFGARCADRERGERVRIHPNTRNRGALSQVWRPRLAVLGFPAISSADRSPQLDADSGFTKERLRSAFALFEVRSEASTRIRSTAAETAREGVSHRAIK